MEAKRNNALVEKYEYSNQGARIKDHRRWCNDSRSFSYDRQGRLKAAGNCNFTWSDSGSLHTAECNGTITRYHYGDDTRLDTVLLPRGVKITYHYDKELLPVKVSRNGLPIMEFNWKNTLHLTRYMDRIDNVLYVFTYNEEGRPKQVTLSGPEAVISRITGQPEAPLKLNIHVDHLGSIRCLETPDGVVVKSVEYDSFGNVMHDSRPNFPFPLGFAGGLVDPFTGFIRFGYRDYDPSVGRFTAKDPLGDTGGDHDLYDYCVDDPISCMDTLGLQEVDIDGKVKRITDNHLFQERPMFPLASLPLLLSFFFLFLASPAYPASEPSADSSANPIARRDDGLTDTIIMQTPAGYVDVSPEVFPAYFAALEKELKLSGFELLRLFIPASEIPLLEKGDFDLLTKDILVTRWDGKRYPPFKTTIANVAKTPLVDGKQELNSPRITSWFEAQQQGGKTSM